eukprot:COSAG02_NODE_13939_length_1329_cov_0.917886_1_plen_60_part_10
MLVRQDRLKDEQMQMDVLESTDSMKKKAQAIDAISFSSKLPSAQTTVPTSPRAVLALARE